MSTKWGDVEKVVGEQYIGILEAPAEFRIMKLESVSMEWGDVQKVVGEHYMGILEAPGKFRIMKLVFDARKPSCVRRSSKRVRS